MDWSLVGWVMASRIRRGIVRALSDGPKTPKDLSRFTSSHISQVSATLADLSRRRVVELLNKGARKGRLYGLTAVGKRLNEEVSRAESGPRLR